MGKYDELIMAVQNYQQQEILGLRLKPLLSKILEALKAENERFDLIEHLRSGKEATTSCGTYVIAYDRVNGQFRTRRGAHITSRELIKYEWQPYEEEPFEPGWYWVTHRNSNGKPEPMHLNTLNVSPVMELKVLRNKDGALMRIEEPKDEPVGDIDRMFEEVE